MDASRKRFRLGQRGANGHLMFNVFALQKHYQEGKLETPERRLQQHLQRQPLRNRSARYYFEPEVQSSRSRQGAVESLS